MFSNLRIGGLVSGMDIDSIVEDLMKAHRLPVQKMEQDKQILEWKQEDYRNINTTLRSFRDTAFDMRLQSTYLTKKSSSSDENVVTATANPTVATGSYTVKVTSLASGVSKGSQVALSSEKGDGKTLTLQEQFEELSGIDSLSFKIINGSGESAVIELDTTTENIYDVVNKINSHDLGIKASYDSNYRRFFLTTETTGEKQQIKITDDANNFLSYDIGGSSTDTVLKLDIEQGSEEYTGTNAKFDFGDLTDLTSSTNNVTVNGISMELKDAGTSTITVSNDTGAVFDTIVKFIDEYNSTVEAIGNKLHETRYRDYKPLTEEQRGQLTDDQIDRWIEKARSGLLRNDPILSGAHSKMRFTMSAVVPTGGEYDRLVDIGITTTQDYMSGKLVVDEGKLREAIENDPQGIMELFTHDPDSGEYSQMGIARRLYEDVNNAMSSISTKAGSQNDYSLVDNSVIGKEIDRIEEEIERKNERLQQVEDRYWRQFTAMEKAIQRMNQQSMWLSQQMGMGTS
jgi:flagellar hook-associated protein 2